MAGLLSPADIVNRTAGLLHNPDVLLQLGLLAPRGGSGKAELDPHGLSAVKLSKPLSEVQIRRAINTKMAPQVTISPEQFYAQNKGSVMLPAVGDKSIGGQMITNVEGTPMGVQTYGGGSFMRTHSPFGSVWASDLPQSVKLANQIRAAQEGSATGKVFITHATMAPRAIDFSHHVSDTLLGMLPNAKISRAGQQAIKDRMAHGLTETTSGGSKRFTYPDFPGIFSPRLPEWLNKSGWRRKHFVKLMDSKQMQDVGVPSVAVARLAATDVGQLGVPHHASGMHIGEAFPGTITGGLLQHPSYPVQTPGRYEASFGTYIPRANMFPDWTAANAGRQNVGRAFEIGGVGRAQPITQQWLDQIMPVYQGLLSNPLQ